MVQTAITVNIDLGAQAPAANIWNCYNRARKFFPFLFLFGRLLKGPEEAAANQIFNGLSGAEGINREVFKVWLNPRLITQDIARDINLWLNANPRFILFYDTNRHIGDTFLWMRAKCIRHKSYLQQGDPALRATIKADKPKSVVIRKAPAYPWLFSLVNSIDNDPMFMGAVCSVGGRSDRRSLRWTRSDSSLFMD